MNDMNNCILENEEIVTERAHGAATNTSGESTSSTYWRDRYPANYQPPADLQANYLLGRGRVVVEALLAEINKLVTRPFARYDPAVVSRAREWLKDTNKPACDGEKLGRPRTQTAETHSRFGDYYQCPYCKSFLGHRLIVKDMEETWESHRKVCTARRKQYTVSGPGVHSILRAYPHLLCEQHSYSVLAEMSVSTAEALQRDYPTLSVEENIGYTHKTR